MTDYDSTADTLKHIQEVQKGILNFCMLMMQRAMVHDQSKLGEEEKSYFDRETPALKTLTYGSAEYRESLTRLGTALSHHYQVNDHHPEHFVGGINGMNLMQLVEMFFDWVAAAQRTKGGTMNLDASFERFKFEDVKLENIFKQTASELNIPFIG